MQQKAKLTRWLPWLGILLITLIAAISLGGSPPYGDDIRLHFFRIPVLNAMWQEGILFSRWQPTLNVGYGSPLFNFYPPLSAYSLTVLYWLLGQNATIALNLLFVIALFLGTVGMFLLGRHLYGAAGGLLAAALYSWAPHLVFQTYARGSSSNALAMALFPFAAWALIRTGQRPSLTRTLSTAVFIALIMLSHTAASLLFLGPLLLFGLTAVSQPNLTWHTAKPKLRAILAALLLGLGLSAFSWLPALADIQHTRYDSEASQVNYQENFADILRWPDPTIAQAHNPSLPKSAGFAQISLGLLGTAVALWRLWHFYSTQKRHGTEEKTSHPFVDSLTTVAGLLGLVTLFLALSPSTFVWEWLTPLQSLQFPWRLLDIPVFFLALAAGRLLLPPPAKWRTAVAILGLLLAFSNMIPYLYPPQIELPTEPTLADATAVQQQFGIFGLTAWGEYSNPTIHTWPVEPPFLGADEMIPLTEKLENGLEGVTAVSGTPWQATWQTNLTQPETISLFVHQFPGWQARLDNEPHPIDIDTNGRLQLHIPDGEHTLELAFRRTPIHWLADLLTLTSLFILGIGLIVSWRHRHGRESLATRSTQSSPRLLLLLICLFTFLLLLKIMAIDRLDNPLVVHLQNGRVANFSPPATGSFNDQIQLIGSQLTTPDSLVLLWQAQQDDLPRAQIQLTLTDPQGAPIKTLRNETPGYTVTTNWQTGELIRDEVNLPINDLPGPIGYQLSLSVQNLESGELLPLTDGATAVIIGRTKKAPPATDIAQTVGTQFGQAIKLRHTDIPAQISADEPLEFSLIWESIAPLAEDMTVFVHLLHPDGSFAAGQDAPPLNGRYPTSFWEPGEIIVDGRVWQTNLPPGQYQLQVGLYHPLTGERLPLSGPLSELADRIILQEVEILP